MNEAIEPIVRISVFAAVFVTMSVWERLEPLRDRTVKRSARWTGNLLLLSINTGLLRLFMPLSIVGIALFAEHQGIGLFRQFPLPAWFAIVVTVLVLDLAVFAQHVALHKIPLLWRLHLVHHTDLDFDVTTGVRFHTLEILLSAAYKAAIVMALGLPAVGVLIFEVLLNATSMFSHGNVRLPRRIEPVVRWFLVTPEMHRVHHSVIPQETNSNFGFNSPWWDRLFGTYRAQPRHGHEGMTIGLAEERDERRVARITNIILLPIIASYARTSRSEAARPD